MNRFPIKHAWRKSTFCNGADACVEVALVWVNGVAMVAVRDSKDRDSAVLTVEPGAWGAFLAALRLNRARGSVQAGGLHLDYCGDDGWLMSHVDAMKCLEFDGEEIRKFVGGVGDGEFDLTALTVSAGDG